MQCLRYICGGNNKIGMKLQHPAQSLLYFALKGPLLSEGGGCRMGGGGWSLLSEGPLLSGLIEG